MCDFQENITCPICGYDFISDKYREEESLTLEEMDEYFDGEDYRCPICGNLFTIERLYYISPKEEGKNSC